MSPDLGNPTLDTPDYDALIIGAGPAGGIAAALLSARGYRVLLVEKSPWPRDKACGGCINAAGTRLLQQHHLAPALQNAAPLLHMQLHSGHRIAHIPIPPGAIVDRKTFDAQLVALAVSRGTTFLSESRAQLLPQTNPHTRAIRIHTKDGEIQINTRVILSCDGLAKPATSFLADEPWAAVTTAPNARLGFALTLPAESLPPIPPGTLHMCLGPHGYAGLVPLPDNHVHIGAAFSPAACNAHHGPLPLIENILRSAGLPLQSTAFQHLPFTGTGPLTTHRATVGRHRILALGDAAGYVEPFTGEGISWAIRAAVAATGLLPQNPRDIPPDIGTRWHNFFTATLRPRQNWCHHLRAIIARPNIAHAGVRLAQLLPATAGRLAHHISA